MIIRRGASGVFVKQVQTRLSELGLYRGPIDGIFGGGSEAAVKTFQRGEALAVDGRVCDATWNLLFPKTAFPACKQEGQSLSLRCLALTGSFETTTAPPDCFAGLSGNFDGMGISFGALQWNLGQGTLQPILLEMLSHHRNLCEDIFHDFLPVLESTLRTPQEEQVAFSRTLQDGRCRIAEPWKGMLKTLGRTGECQAIQGKSAQRIQDRALALCQEYGLTTERGVALMFDICVQNGSVGKAIKTLILQDFSSIAFKNYEAVQIERMRIIAKRRAAVARPQFVADVLRRKLCIAEGSGTVHGVHYDLEEQYGLSMQSIELKPAA